MPNHVRNVVKIKGIETEEKRDYLLRKLTTIYVIDKDTNTKEKIIDFDLIIPEPRYKKDCPIRYHVNKDSHVREIEGREWFNWYDWHIDHWGTKWNAYDGYTKIGKTVLTLVFNTAWSAPFTIYEKLTELGYDLEIRFADESIGSNCGKIIYDASEHESEAYLESKLKDPDAFARYIWYNY